MALRLQDDQQGIYVLQSGRGTFVDNRRGQWVWLKSPFQEWADLMGDGCQSFLFAHLHRVKTTTKAFF